MSDILNQLNEAQREAAACVEGPMMIIAGAGSGKTRTLTYRIAHLIETGVDPFNILALTFTNKAASEMRERIIKLVGDEAKNIWMGTFHSVFCRILRREAIHIGYAPNFTIYDTDDSKRLISHIVKEFNLDPKAYSAKHVLNRISSAKSNLVSDADYLRDANIQAEDKAARKPEIGRIYHAYTQRMHNAMAMDFDDLLFNTNILLRDHPDVLLRYQKKFRHILVDEYQDTNYAQYLIVKKLAARLQNICVVGDDAQSIYAFRGANIQNILNFKKDYPDMRLFKLEQNYRSTQVIVNAANAIIANNQRQIPKTIWTDNSEGSKIKLLRAPDERSEAGLVVEQIVEAHQNDNRNYTDFAVLYRNNAQSRALEEALRRNNIPYHIYSGISFYGRKEVKDILAYLRLVVNNHDDESLLRIINYPARGIGATTMNKVQIAAADNEVSIFTVLENLSSFALGLNAGTTGRLTDFVMAIKAFSTKLYELNAYDLATRVVRFSGIIKMLQQSGDQDDAERIENIEELLNGIQEFCQTDDEITPEDKNLEAADSPAEVAQPTAVASHTLDLFLQQVLLLTSEDKDKESRDQVSLMTIHAAKGLEFPYVFITGMEENLFPNAMCIGSRQDLEEERRLFYVAVTRAEQRLFLTYALTRYSNGRSSCQEPSRFIDEVEDYLDEPASRAGAFPPPGSVPRPDFASLRGQSASTSQDASSQGVSAQRRFVKKPSLSAKGPAMVNGEDQINAIQAGMMVKHAKFGIGKVVQIEDSADSRKAVVYFEGQGTKVLLLKFAKLTIIPLP